MDGQDHVRKHTWRALLEKVVADTLNKVEVKADYRISLL